MNYRCPNCQQVYTGMLRYCPYCGTTIRYNQNDDMAIDNYSSSRRSNTSTTMEKVGYIGQMMQSCGCILLCVWLLAFFIFLLIVIL
ncbi:hypothetical protein AKUA1404_04880 [Apilactobacillus kunkeei]|nr:hypothetical protein AKUA1404_04880 [Apilactobacillus kunkeei]